MPSPQHPATTLLCMPSPSPLLFSFALCKYAHRILYSTKFSRNFLGRSYLRKLETLNSQENLSADHIPWRRRPIHRRTKLVHCPAFHGSFHIPHSTSHITHARIVFVPIYNFHKKECIKYTPTCVAALL